MNSETTSSSVRVTALIASLLLGGVPLTFAETPPSDVTWEDLGFSQLPEGYPTDGVALFQGLTEARGTWSFEGREVGGGAVNGSLEIVGNPKQGMMPVWRLSWSWPAGDMPEGMTDTVTASPGKDGIEWMLVREGPPTMFRMFGGSWDREQRTITWTEKDIPARMRGQEKGEAAKGPRQSFKMQVAADGGISIRNGRNLADGMLLEGRTLARTGEAPAESMTLIGRHHFKTVAEIRDRRITPCLPPSATGISLLSDRGGHYARYKVAEADFKGFLDKLWEEAKDTSAHKRNEMHGEGEPAKPERMAEVFKAAGWDLPDEALVYHSPSKGSGAMTTYYYDRKTGIACHSRGYW